MPRIATNPCPSCGRSRRRSRWRCPACGALLQSHGYVVELLLASGPRGRVYRARHPSHGPVALKELAFATVPDVKTLELFEREGAALRRLDHPRIPRLAETFEDGQGPKRRLYLAQTLFVGEDLEERLRRHAFDEVEVRRVARDVLEVLEYLHSRTPKVIHRDVKPANIIARAEGGFALVDFGSLRDSQVPEHSTLAGTFGYLPPERLSRDADESTDLYALGVTLARLLTRRDIAALYTPELSVCFRPFANVSERFARFVERLLARTTSPDRFGSTTEARCTLEALVAPSALASPTTPGVLDSPGTPAAPSALAGPETSGVLESPGTPAPRATLEVPRGPGAVQAYDPRPDGAPAHGATPPSALNASRAVTCGSSHALPEAPGRDVDCPRRAPGPATGVAWILRVGELAHRLEPGVSYLVGRSESCDVVIPHALRDAETVSRCHLRVRVVPGGLEVTELGSSNGTMVEGRLLEAGGARDTLKDAGELELGRFRVVAHPAFLAVSPLVHRPVRPQTVRARKHGPERLGWLGGDPDGVRIYRWR